VTSARAFLLGLALIASASVAARAEVSTGTAAVAAFAEREDVPGVENFAAITPRICRGAQPSAAGYRELKKRGFKTVVSLRYHHDEGRLVAAAGLKWIHIPLYVGVLGAEPPDEAEIRRFFDAILDPANQPVYFHCGLGRDRTGTMAALYRIEVDGWTNERALKEMDAFGSQKMYRSLRNFVRRYKPRRPRPAAGT